MMATSVSLINGMFSYSIYPGGQPIHRLWRSENYARPWMRDIPLSSQWCKLEIVVIQIQQQSLPAGRFE